MDAPLTPRLISPSVAPPAGVSGRRVEKQFSGNRFSNFHRGPQPSSILVPKQGWPLYQAGMNLLGEIQDLDAGLRYISFADFAKAPDSRVIECIPKLTQALLVPGETVRGRRKGISIDDHLFPLMFPRGGPLRARFDYVLSGLSISPHLEDQIEEIAS